jgi:hypothetical protein
LKFVFKVFLYLLVLIIVNMVKTFHEQIKACCLFDFVIHFQKEIKVSVEILIFAQQFFDCRGFTTDESEHEILDVELEIVDIVDLLVNFVYIDRFTVFVDKYFFEDLDKPGLYQIGTKYECQYGCTYLCSLSKTTYISHHDQEVILNPLILDGLSLNANIDQIKWIIPNLFINISLLVNLDCPQSLHVYEVPRPREEI